ncbi:MAG: tartrate dehydrogenase [Desulfobacterales bacterium]|nr:tartrate dehydrogenase [Desulfobacterales bacterium]
MKDFHLAVIPGDGIGKEVVPAGLRVLNVAAGVHGGYRLTYQTFPWGCEYYVKEGKMMPDNGIEVLKGYDAIFLGAVGYPRLVPDHVSLWGLMLPIRRGLQHYVNLRPIKLLRGVRTPLADRGTEDIDFLVVRENNEGEYSNMGGRLYQGSPQEVVIQNTVFTRFGVERVIRYAFELARETGRKRVTSATKSNAINFTMPFWDSVFDDIAAEYPDLETDKFHMDALSARFVIHPQHFEVVVASNLFGDILTDLGAAIAGSIGIGPSVNLDPERKNPSMFEPVHGSAPDIAGKGIANPVGQIWSGAMMLDHLGFPESGRLVMDAVEAALISGIGTPDLGGDASTNEVTDAICQEIRRLSSSA